MFELCVWMVSKMCLPRWDTEEIFLWHEDYLYIQLFWLFHLLGFQNFNVSNSVSRSDCSTCLLSLFFFFQVYFFFFLCNVPSFPSSSFRPRPCLGTSGRVRRSPWTPPRKAKSHASGSRRPYFPTHPCGSPSLGFSVISCTNSGSGSHPGKVLGPVELRRSNGAGDQ